MQTNKQIKNKNTNNFTHWTAYFLPSQYKSVDFLGANDVLSVLCFKILYKGLSKQ